MTRSEERNLEIIAGMSDDYLIDIATTCSNKGVALAAEMHLRARYPSKIRTKRSPDTACPAIDATRTAPEARE